MENVILTSVPDEATAAAWNDCLDNAEFAGLYTAPEARDQGGVEVAEIDLGRDFDEYYALYQHWCAFKHCAARPSDVQRAVGSCPAGPVPRPRRYKPQRRRQMTGK
jgi:hypothetical protein